MSSSEPIIRVTDIAWIRLRSPDLDLQERFLSDFGLIRSAHTGNALYMRGTDPSHHLHVTEKGDPKVLSVAFWARSEDDLHKLSREAEGASAVEAIDEPGGGRRVRLTDHNGFAIEVVHGVETLPALPVPVNTLNFGREHVRHRIGGVPQRLRRGVRRLRRGDGDRGREAQGLRLLGSRRVDTGQRRHRRDRHGARLLQPPRPPPTPRSTASTRRR